MIYKKSYFIFAAVLLSLITLSTANAHLMVAQKGTLNIVDNDAFMVLSLPVSAFNNLEFDSNNDGLLDMFEFNKNRERMAELVLSSVHLINADTKIVLQGIRLLPELSHKDQQQIVVLGKFSMSEQKNDIALAISLFSKNASEDVLSIRISNKATNEFNEFELNPYNRNAKLFR